MSDKKDTANEATTNEVTANKVTTNEVIANEVTPNEFTANVTIANEVTANEATANKVTPNEVTANVPIANETTANEAIANKDIKKLRKAIKVEDLASIDKCIQEGFIIDKSYNYTTRSCRTVFRRKDEEFIPLLYAVKNQKIKVVEFFLKKDRSNRLKEIQNDEKALSIATEKGNLKIVKLLVEKSRKPNMETALFIAIENNKLDIARYMVKNGADVLIKPENRETMLSTAAKMENLEMIKLLIENGGKPTIQKAFMYAIKSNRLDIVKYMVENGGARVDWKYKNGDEPLVTSFIMKCEEIAKFLIDKGASLEEFEFNGARHTPLFYSLEYQLFDVFKHLVKKNCVNVNQENEKGETALAIAASKKYFNLVTFLIESKADISLAQKDIDEYAGIDEDFGYYYQELKLKYDEEKALSATDARDKRSDPSTSNQKKQKKH